MLKQREYLLMIQEEQKTSGTCVRVQPGVEKKK